MQFHFSFSQLVSPTSPQEVATVAGSLNATSVSMSWLGPRNVNGSVLNYTVQCFHKGIAYRPATRTVGNETLIATVTGLHPYANYSCCVAASNFVGRGDLKCATQFQTAEAGKIIVRQLPGIWAIYVDSICITAHSNASCRNGSLANCTWL